MWKTRKKIERSSKLIIAVGAVWIGGVCSVYGSDAVKVALVLPFSTQRDAMKARTVEYYEGVLLAVDSMRRAGMSLELSVFDAGDETERIERLIHHGKLEGIELVIGGMDEQIPLLADFTAQRGIKYVIPFTPHNDKVLNHDNVFEVNTAHSQLYKRIAQATCEEFIDDHLIIVRIPDDKEKNDFIRTFRQQATAQHLICHEMTFEQNTFLHEIQTLTDTDRRHVIIPTTSSFEGFNKIRTSLRSLLLAGRRIVLFGYPDWQTFVHDTDDDLYLLNTCIYSSFYADHLSPDLHRFYHTYHRYFGRNLINTFPKYGLLGYDTALFFLESIRLCGTDFTSCLLFSDTEPLQTGFRFEHTKGDEGGYINTHIFFVHYNSDYTVTRNLIP
ncbi:MAG: hypothetical protein LBU03_06350 [Tannerellaceae bacterium]|jgi:hypothetical protein|nr:hypothetical protein [Tannerellaceae bacterium]